MNVQQFWSKYENTTIYTAKILLFLTIGVLLTYYLYRLYQDYNEKEKSIKQVWLMSNHNTDLSAHKTLSQICSKFPYNSAEHRHCKKYAHNLITMYKSNHDNVKTCIQSLPYGDSYLWSLDVFQKYNNCKSYAFQDPDMNLHDKPQLGDNSDMYKDNPMCDHTFSIQECIDRVLAERPDAIYIPVEVEHQYEPTSPCGYHKVALVLDMGSVEKGKILEEYGYSSTYNTLGWDFHWYRQDANGLWSHKPGSGDPEFTDASNKLIRHPRFADRDYTKKGKIILANNYQVIAAYFFVPSSNHFADKVLWLYENTSEF